MRPAIPAGRLVVFRRRRIYKPGDVVLVSHGGLEKIKRITDINDGQVFLSGDNPDNSTDSRHFGRLPVKHIRGAAILLRKRPKNAKIG